MPEPRRIGDLLAETLAAIRARGPVLTRLDVSQALYAMLAAEHFRTQSLYGYTPEPWLGVSVIVDRGLPPYARREHYSDGRVVTRYRPVLDPRVLQLRVSWQTRHAGPPEAHTTDLSLMVRRFGWVHATDPETGGSYSWEWKGARSCAYLPGLKALTDMAGLELTDWQRDYVTKAMEAHRAGLRVSVHAPRMHGLGGGTL